LSLDTFLRTPSNSGAPSEHLSIRLIFAQKKRRS
jgi:hypothetical protein